MRKKISTKWGVRLASAVALGAAGPLVGVAGTAAAEGIWAWRTDDGVYAFADDEKSIPARYRDRAELRSSTRLGDYERYTPKDDAASRSYEQQLAERLGHLRRLNASYARQREAPLPGVDSVSMRLGGNYAPSVTLTQQELSEAPVIIEKVRVKGRGQIATRHDTVVRRGDRTLAIIRGANGAESNASQNVMREEELVD